MQKMQEMIDERNKNNLLSWVFFLAINLEVSNFVVFSSHAFWHPLPNFGKGRHVYSIMLQIPMECACNQKIALEKCYIFCLPPPPPSVLCSMLMRSSTGLVCSLRSGSWIVSMPFSPIRSSSSISPVSYCSLWSSISHRPSCSLSMNLLFTLINYHSSGFHSKGGPLIFYPLQNRGLCSILCVSFPFPKFAFQCLQSPRLRFCMWIILFSLAGDLWCWAHFCLDSSSTSCV